VKYSWKQTDTRNILGKISPVYMGFRFYDKKNKITGTVKEINENPGQLLLNIITEKNNSILIPFIPI
jgi:hypothetical protein